MTKYNINNRTVGIFKDEEYDIDFLNYLELDNVNIIFNADIHNNIQTTYHNLSNLDLNEVNTIKTELDEQLYQELLNYKSW